jgi:hypothetical protein
LKKQLYYILFIFCFGITAVSANTAVKKDSLTLDTSTIIKKRTAVKKIKNKYSGRNFNYVENKDEKKLSTWQRFKERFAKFIEDFFNVDSPQASRRIVNRILEILGILVIIFVLYKIVKVYMNDEGNWVFGRKSDKVNINATNIHEDIHEIDFETSINDAIRANDYRLAIRYYYLLSLKKLSEKDIIEWDNEKTNYDYFQEIKDKKLQKQFRYISYIYDYCWYGEFEINTNDYETGEKAFRKLINSI